jgi:hypothetical protein
MAFSFHFDIAIRGANLTWQHRTTPLPLMNKPVLVHVYRLDRALLPTFQDRGSHSNSSSYPS